MSTPDYAEPIVGWRVWRIVPEGDAYGLGSVLAPTRWVPGEPLEAGCLHGPSRELLRPWRKRPAHAAPETGCSCGIYAAREAGRAADYLWRPDTLRWDVWPRVIGCVSLWGRVVECANGWRAALAYPLRVFVPAAPSPRHVESPERLAEALAVYRVPVELIARDELSVLLQAE